MMVQQRHRANGIADASSVTLVTGGGRGVKEAWRFKVILIVLALTLVIFGGWRLLDPIGFYAFSGLELSNDAGPLSEVRGAGGIIMVSGLVVALGAFRHAWSRTSIVLAAVVFLSLGLARVLGLVLDGFPGAGAIQGMIIELALGGLALFAFFTYGGAGAKPGREG
ncbi:MAG: DUF4345 domain-containing protein [Trueperaceae bacterium]|nr:DUF4345 domain-containing protein [Trueperaceae bacterium]